MRRSSAELSSDSGLRATAVSSAWENSRPIAAPTCATSLAVPRRSSRAISEACRLAGTAIDGEGNSCNCSLGFLATCLQHSFGYFLHEQWNAICTLDDVLAHARRERLVTRNTINDRADFVLPEPIEREGSDMRPSNPRRVKLRSVRDD